MSSPGWLAVRVQVPVPLVMVTVVPLIEQAPEAARLTASPEVALAETEKLAPETAVAGAPVKLMVWLCFSGFATK